MVNNFRLSNNGIKRDVNDILIEASYKANREYIDKTVDILTQHILGPKMTTYENLVIAKETARISLAISFVDDLASVEE